jgi:hypothetical protein
MTSDFLKGLTPVGSFFKNGLLADSAPFIVCSGSTLSKVAPTHPDFACLVGDATMVGYEKSSL